MRIIGGDARGRTIVAPAGAKTRPTQDYVRESLFNIIRWDIEEAPERVRSRWRHSAAAQRKPCWSIRIGLHARRFVKIWKPHALAKNAD